MMPAGTYYVGDLCYVMHDRWDEFCNITIVGHDVLDGEMQLSDGTRFATYKTMYGDGLYYDREGRRYPVDAGLIGCVLLSDIAQEELANVVSGNVITFDAPFRTGVSRHGTIWFGDVEIETGDMLEGDESEYEE